MGMHARSEPAPVLLERQWEREALDGLIEDPGSGRGWALVVRGEAGVGKSVLLEYAPGAAPDMRVARAAGGDGAGVRRPASAVRAAAELPGAASGPAAATGLHICAP